MIGDTTGDRLAANFSAPARILMVVLAMAASARSQSNPADFATVIEVPPTAIGDNASIGPDTQLNIRDGGTIGDGFSAGISSGSPASNIEVNLFGGEVGSRFSALTGSTVNVLGGQLLGTSRAEAGSRVNIRGGVIGGPVNDFDGFLPGLTALAGSHVVIDGGEFIGRPRIHAGADVTINGGQLAGRTNGRRFTVGDGVQLTINGGNFGTSDRRGEFGLEDTFWVSEGGTVLINGGDFPAAFHTVNGARTVINGGRFGAERYTLQFLNTINLGAEAETTIGGGSFVAPIQPRLGQGQSLTQIEFVGADFTAASFFGDGSTGRYTRQPSVATGVFADGSPFLFDRRDLHDIRGINVRVVDVPAPDPTPIRVDSTSAPAPYGIRDGQTLTVAPGGRVKVAFVALGATLNVIGGEVASHARLSDTALTVTSGSIGESLRTYGESEVSISGGEIGPDMELGAGGGLVLEGGRIGDRLTVIAASVEQRGGAVGSGLVLGAASMMEALGGTIGVEARVASEAELIVEGGTVGDRLSIDGRGSLRLRGGSIGTGVRANANSLTLWSGGSLGAGATFRELSNLYIAGTEFLLDGVLVDELRATGDVLRIDTRDQVLSGRLLDGSPFELDLTAAGPNTIHPNARLLVSLNMVVPEPTGLTLLGAVIVIASGRRLTRSRDTHF